MEENLNLYDSINTEAVKWLVYNKEKYADICISQLKHLTKQNLWFLEIMRVYDTLYKYNIYISTNYFYYLYLKYIKHYKFLKFFTWTKMVLPIKPNTFIEELTDAFEVKPEIVEKIYDIYYKR